MFEMQRGKEVEAVGGATDGVIVKEVGKKKKIISGSQWTVNDTLSNEIQNGHEVEAVGRATDGAALKQVEKKKKKKKKKKKNKIINGIESTVNDTSSNEMQNGKEVEAVATDVDVVKEFEKKKKKKLISVHSSALQQENACLSANEAQENEDQNEGGAKVEATGEDCEVENIRKRKKKKREKKKENDVLGDSGQGILAEKSTNGYDKKKKKKLISVRSGALKREKSCLGANEAQVNKDQNGEGAKVEAIGEDCEVENIRKRKKNKREKKESDILGDSGQSILAEESTNGY